MIRKRILIVSELFYPEEFNINDIALFWANNGFEVDVLTLSPTYPFGKVYKGYKNKIFYREDYQGINIYRVKAVSGYQKSLFKKILKYLNFMILGSIVGAFIGKKYDYIFGFNVGALTSMVPAYTIRKLYKKPLMIWIQDLWPDTIYAYGFKRTKLRKYFLDKFIKSIYHNASSIAISGKGFELKLKNYVDDNIKLNYIPNWADDFNTEFKPASLSTENKTHFTFAGNLGKLQNLEKIIESFSLLDNADSDRAQLNIIGDGSNLLNLKNLAKHNLNIVFHGRKKREEMPKFYLASDFLIVALVDDPIFSVLVPAKLQAYIAAKKPILAIINGDTSDIVINNNLGLYANPSDAQAIKNTFVECINMSDLEKKNFISQGEKLLKDDFNKNKIMAKLTNVLVNK